MNEIERSYHFVVQRLHDNGVQWIDSSASYHQDEGLVAALEAHRTMVATFSSKLVRIVRRDIVITESVIDDKDVHTEHCCYRHGCKYGEGDSCTVSSGLKQQSYMCEGCDDELYVAGGWALAHLMNEMYERGRMVGFDRGLEHGDCC